MGETRRSSLPKVTMRHSGTHGALAGSNTDAQPSQLGELGELPDITQQSQAKATPLKDVMHELKLERAAEILKRVSGVQGSSAAEVVDAACHALGIVEEAGFSTAL